MHNSSPRTKKHITNKATVPSKKNGREVFRFNKKEHSIHSSLYKELIEKEISYWSNAGEYHQEASGTGWDNIKNDISYRTYDKGTFEKELSYIRSAGKGIHVLELGSSDGWLTTEIAKLSNVQTVTAIDISLTKKLKKHYLRQDRKNILVQGDLNHFRSIAIPKKKRYDVIITHGTLHHLVDPKGTILYFIKEHLKTNGLFIIKDKWVLQGLQYRTNAVCFHFSESIKSLFRGLYKLITLDLKNFGVQLFLSIKNLLFIFPSLLSTHFAMNNNNRAFSPFESISSAEDYKDIYADRSLVTVVLFKNYAALPLVYLLFPKATWEFPGFKWLLFTLIPGLDRALIKSRLYAGCQHLCILKKQ